MERNKLLRLALIPVVTGLIVTLLARQMLPAHAANSSTNPVTATLPVVAIAAKEGVAARTKLAPEQLVVKQVPKDALTGREFSDLSAVVGQVTQVALEPGEVILQSRVLPEGQGAMPYRIPKGMRASTVRMDELTGVAGYPEPGDLVDLVLFLPAKAPERPLATSRILYEAVLVLGKGPAPVNKAGGPPEAPKMTSLTLALTPEASVELALAEQLGVIKFLLRPAQKETDAGKLLLNENKYQQTAAPGR